METLNMKKWFKIFLKDINNSSLMKILTLFQRNIPEHLEIFLWCKKKNNLFWKTETNGLNKNNQTKNLKFYKTKKEILKSKWKRSEKLI